MTASLYEWRDRAEGLRRIVKPMLIERQKMSASTTDDIALAQQLRRMKVPEDLIEWVLSA